jgi:hypothetical protein
LQTTGISKAFLCGNTLSPDTARGPKGGHRAGETLKSICYE